MITNPEFSYFINCETLKEAEKTYQIEATIDQCKEIAAQFNLLSLDNLVAEAVVCRISGDLVRLGCSCSAKLVQSCVVTSKPLESRLNFTFEREFSASAKAYIGRETEPDWDADEQGNPIDDQAPEPPDPMRDGGFDLGECVTEQLSLEIDPFPRAQGASFDDMSKRGVVEGKAARAGPFAVLEQLKKK